MPEETHEYPHAIHDSPHYSFGNCMTGKTVMKCSPDTCQQRIEAIDSGNEEALQEIKNCRKAVKAYMKYINA